MIISFLTRRIHPLLPIAITYILGICWCPVTPPYSLLMTASCITFIGLGYMLWLKINPHKIVSLLLACMVAFCAGGINRDIQRRKQTTLVEQLQQKSSDYIAQIKNIDAVDHPFYRHCITINLQHILQNNADWKPLKATIAIYTTHDTHNNDLCIGDIIGIHGLTFKKITNPSFENYLLKEGVLATLFIAELNCTLIKRPFLNWQRFVCNLKNNTLLTLKRKMSPRTFQLFASIFLGNKQSPKKLTEKTKDHFTTWGVTHYLARSGLHMVIFVIIWQFLLNLLPLPWNIKELILLFLGIIYCLLSWPSVSFNRAFFTFLLYKICTLLRLQTNFLHLLTLVCLFILIGNPIQIFFLDFQLSFGLTFALGCFTQIQVHHKYQRYQTIAS